MSEWQPIESAPRYMGGDHVLLGSTEHDWVCEAFWHDFFDYEIKGKRLRGSNKVWEGAHGWAVHFLDVTKLKDIWDSPPTHWQPLPPPPVKSGSQAANEQPA